MISMTSKQLVLWKLKREGLSISEIAARLNISRQAVHKSLQAIEAKVYKALTSAATSTKVEIRRIDIGKGILIGWSPWLKTDVYITFSAKNGVQIWFKHEGNCLECPLRSDCKRVILEEAEERGIELSENENLEPSRLIELFFRKVLEV